MDTAEKLAQAGKKAEEQKAERRARTVKGSHLLPALEQKIAASGLKTQDMAAFKKVKGAAKARKVFVATKGGRVDLSGFTFDHPAVIQISAEDAKEKHIGRVRGQLDFDKDDAQVLEAFDRAIELLKEEAAEEKKDAGADYGVQMAGAIRRAAGELDDIPASIAFMALAIYAGEVYIYLVLNGNEPKGLSIFDSFVFGIFFLTMLIPRDKIVTANA